MVSLSHLRPLERGAAAAALQMSEAVVRCSAGSGEVRGQTFVGLTLIPRRLQGRELPSG